jgi:hypothetical protein
MTSTTVDRNARHLVEDRRRARTLRWLLKLATANHLPMPKRIEFGAIECRGDTLRYLSLDLDHGLDLTGWANAIDADDGVDEFEVIGDTHQWNLVRVQTTWRSDGPRRDWNHIEVTSRHGYRPLTDPAAVTA